MKAFVRLGKKLYTVKEWKKFDYPHQSVLLRKFDIILTGHKTKGRMKFVRGDFWYLKDDKLVNEKETWSPFVFSLKGKLKTIPGKVMQIDIDKSLTAVTKNIDDFSTMMDSMKGIGGKQKDLSGLLSNQKKGKLTL